MAYLAAYLVEPVCTGLDDHQFEVQQRIGRLEETLGYQFERISDQRGPTLQEHCSSWQGVEE